MSIVLSIQDLHKHYGLVHALKGISFDVPEGSVYGVLGPNGSGKTTLLGILLDVLQQDRGSFQWLGGLPHHVARRQIGALLETPNFYHYLSAVRNLEINAGIKQRGKQDIDRVLDVVKLSHRKHSAFSTYSLGMKQRLAIANALLDNPKVLVLDEPTNGLDPEGIAEIRDLIISLNRQGMTILIASHLLDEVEKVCTHAAVLKQGTLLGSGYVREVFGMENWLEISAADLQVLQQALAGHPGIRQLTTDRQLVRIVLQNGTTPADINQSCFDKGIVLSHLQLRRKSLEAQFMELTR